MSRNAAAAAEPPSPQTEEVTPLSRKKVRLLLKTAKEEGNRLEALYILAIEAGLRHGELLGLQWADVRLFADGGGGEVVVGRTLGCARAVRDGGRGHAFSPPKTGKARVVRFGSGIAAELQAHKKRQLEEKVRFGPSYEDTEQVFTSEGGGLLCPWMSARAFNGLLKRAGLEGFRFHDLRHTAATLALLEGVSAKVVQEMLGHAKIS